MILRGVNPGVLTAQQMANVSYALMVRDHASGVDRTRLDRVLEGAIDVDAPLDERQFSGPVSPPWGQREPTDAEVDALRDTWGKDNAAAARRMESLVAGLPPMGAPKRARDT